jgi:hypothetical protein
VRSNIPAPNKIIKQYDEFQDLFRLDVEQFIKEFGMLEKPLGDYTSSIEEYHARALEVEVHTPNLIDCTLIRVMVTNLKQSFIDRAEYVCTRLKKQVCHFVIVIINVFSIAKSYLCICIGHVGKLSFY